MFTNKEANKFIEYIKTAMLKKVDFPDLNFPSWLPDGIEKAILWHADMIKNTENQKVARLVFDFYDYQVKMLKRILPLYTDNSMKEMWLALNAISEEKTTSFAGSFIMLENGFDGAVSMYLKHKNDKECFNRLLKETEKLKDIMEEYYCHYYGHMITKEFSQLQELLPVFEKKSRKKLKQFEKGTKDVAYLVSDNCPITREFHKETALQIFFIRKISEYFREIFGKPFNKYVADIVNLLFKTAYIDNDIIKITKYKKPKGENS